MKSNKIWLLICCGMICTGCWDQHLMKNATLVQTVTYDLTPKKLLRVGAATPVLNNTDSLQNVTLVAEAITPGEARILLNRKASGLLDSSKNKLLLLGEAYAVHDILPFLDIHYRNPRNALDARVAVVKGEALPLIQLKSKSEINVSRYLLNLIQSAEESLLIPKEDIQAIASEIMDPGEDITLPYIEMESNNQIANVKGIALFNESKYTGHYLNYEQSPLLLLLKGEKPRQNSFSLNFESSKEEFPRRQVVSFLINKSKRKLKLTVDEQQISVAVHMKLVLRVIEYPNGDVEADKEKLMRELTAYFTKLTGDVIHQLQSANCDAFGIGRMIIAYHPDIWRRLDKDQYFKQIKFSPNIQIDEIKSGIEH
ncbi:Ger(x)C family spore germination protein [Paenibacillus sp. UMB4589-SE434]|uniref:Ger(x)C family spore germination protein n=1 Tax=Paenibacillus sp. UMB4589-SE434 TaxID=3046314 RepID=UPI00254ACC5C|nr:Ger(x)C family spore germination protein [Paenibacillus sp. UMB4589-SE434]MDK8179824.1 Ger(x)C family spore germination protein [Paenibacillus sp. UMB4589-SE434]